MPDHLYYSAKQAKACGICIGRLEDGTIVEYSEMTSLDDEQRNKTDIEPHAHRWPDSVYLSVGEFVSNPNPPQVESVCGPFGVGSLE